MRIERLRSAGVLLAVALMGAAPVQRLERTAGQEYLDRFLEIVRVHDWKADTSRWPAMADSARHAAAEATDELSVYAIMARVFDAIGDDHAGMSPTPATLARYRARYGHLWATPHGRWPESRYTRRTSIAIRDEAVGADTIRVLVVPRLFGGQDEPAYADTLFRALIEAPASRRGFVVDLRGNAGGDMWPMLAAMSPLLGNGEPGAFTSRTAGPDRWFLHDGATGLRHGSGRRDTIFTFAGWRTPPTRLESAPVAVLLDDGTMSAGEALAVAFAGRGHTRSFGARTYGLSTANTPFHLSDSTTVWLAVGVYRDRRGREYPSGVPPDVPIAVDSADSTGDGPAMAAACAWMVTASRAR